jgi:hypothetical protein
MWVSFASALTRHNDDSGDSDNLEHVKPRQACREHGRSLKRKPLRTSPALTAEANMAEGTLVKSFRRLFLTLFVVSFALTGVSFLQLLRELPPESVSQALSGHAPKAAQEIFNCFATSDGELLCHEKTNVPTVTFDCTKTTPNNWQCVEKAFPSASQSTTAPLETLIITSVLTFVSFTGIVVTKFLSWRKDQRDAAKENVSAQ